MTTRKKQPHFLSYTIEHVFGMLFVMSVAIFLGYGAYAADTPTGSASSTLLSSYALTPPVLTVSSVTSGKISLSWTTASIPGTAQGFMLYRNGANIANLTVASYEDSTSLVPGTTYEYYVKTMNSAGTQSSPSNTVTVTLPSAASGNTTATTGATSTAASNPTSTAPPSTETAPTTASEQQLSFGVTVAPITDCTSGKPMTEVFFVVSDPVGGSFRLTSDNGIKDAPLEWGRYPFSNGKYSWKAVVNPGYAVSGDASGYFQLSGTCAASTMITTTAASSSVTQSAGVTATADAFPLKYPELVSVVPIITIDNVKVADGGTISGLVTFDVVTKGSTRTVFVYEDAAGVKQFIGKELGVTHKDGTDEWSVLWSTTNMQDGTYKLAALFDTNGGTMISKRVTFSVKNAKVAASDATVIVKRPSLKLFLNNIAVGVGGTLDPGAKLELRVGAASAKKVNFYALYPTAASPLEIGGGVIDDLLSGSKEDIWTAIWDTGKAKPGTYKVFARILSTDGTSLESIPIPVTLLPTLATAATTTSSDESIGTSSKKEEERAIIARILVPSACTTPEECAIYCKSDVASGSCKSFARIVMKREEGVASLADGVSKERITSVLADPKKRSDIPDIVRTPEELLLYCGEPTHADQCARSLEKNDLATKEELLEKRAELDRVRDEERKLLSERVGARAFIDTDGDGISDYDEVNLYHTDPSSQDTDKDGVPDDLEIVNHTDPNGAISKLGTSSSTEPSERSEGVTFENPLVAGGEDKELLSVANVQVAEVGMNEQGTSTAKKLLLSGKAPPNAFVTLYIFSTPIVVTVKADASGAWTYTLDKELADGSHQAISAITDEGGHILARSEALPFVKVAAAVSIGADAPLPSVEPPGFFNGTSLYAFIAIVIGLIGIAFSIIGFVVRGRSRSDEPLFPNVT